MRTRSADAGCGTSANAHKHVSEQPSEPKSSCMLRITSSQGTSFRYTQCSRGRVAGSMRLHPGIIQESIMQASRDIARLIEIMAALRTPGTGCPWDLEQDFASIAPYTLEEAYEVADAIARGDLGDLREELGDLLLQVVFH